MRKFISIFAFLILTLAFYSCDSEISVDDPQSENMEEITTKTGNEGNEGEERGGGG